MRVFLDSCVILSRIPREVLIKAAKEGLLTICYSESVEAESLHVAKRKNMLPEISAAFIDLALVGNKAGEAVDDGLWLPDENDRHVVLGSLAANASVIATENLRDFPRAALEPLNLLAKSPDQIIRPLVENQGFDVSSYSEKQLKRAKLYRTAKLNKHLNNES